MRLAICLVVGILSIRLESNFSETSCLTKAKEPSFSNNLPIHFPKALARSEKQRALSRVWTRIDNSIFYEDNYASYYL